MPPTAPIERVSAYFTGTDLKIAAKALRSYFSPRGCYTGSSFDHLALEGPPDRYVASDYLAVSTLSVNVPPRAALALMEATEVIPSVIDREATLWGSPALLDRSEPAWRWWQAVHDLWGLGPTKTSKLLAVKRPHLLPIYDTVVAGALGFGPSYWAFWQEVARSPEAGRLVAAVTDVAADAKVPEIVSTLRIIDVVVWMREHGASTHPWGLCQECDLVGVGPLRETAIEN